MDIPFTIRQKGQPDLVGFLSPPSGANVDLFSDVPRIFHVMVKNRNKRGEARGDFYWGQLMWNAMMKDWWLPDSQLQPHTDYLGAVVQQWYE